MSNFNLILISVATAALALFNTGKKYIETVFSLAKKSPGKLAFAFFTFPYYFAATLVQITLEYDDPGWEVTLYRCAFIFGALSLVLAPILILPPTKKKILQKESFLKKIASSAQKEESRQKFFVIFCFIILVQIAVVYSLFSILTQANFDAQFIIGILIGYSLLMLFYLVIFYSVMLKKTIVIKNVNLMAQIAKHASLPRRPWSGQGVKNWIRGKEKDTFRFLNTVGYRNFYLGFWLIFTLLSVGYMIMVIIQVDIPNWPVYDGFSKAIVILFYLLDLLLLFTLGGFILNIAFQPVSVDDVVDSETGQVYSLESLRYILIADIQSRRILYSYCNQLEPQAPLIRNSISHYLSSCSTTPGHYSTLHCTWKGIIHHWNDDSYIYLICTGNLFTWDSSHFYSKNDTSVLPTSEKKQLLPEQISRAFLEEAFKKNKKTVGFVLLWSLLSELHFSLHETQTDPKLVSKRVPVESIHSNPHFFLAKLYFKYSPKDSLRPGTKLAKEAFDRSLSLFSHWSLCLQSVSWINFYHKSLVEKIDTAIRSIDSTLIQRQILGFEPMKPQVSILPPDLPTKTSGIVMPMYPRGIPQPSGVRPPPPPQGLPSGRYFESTGIKRHAGIGPPTSFVHHMHIGGVPPPPGGVSTRTDTNLLASIRQSKSLKKVATKRTGGGQHIPPPDITSLLATSMAVRSSIVDTDDEFDDGEWSSESDEEIVERSKSSIVLPPSGGGSGLSVDYSAEGLDFSSSALLPPSVPIATTAHIPPPRMSKPSQKMVPHPSAEKKKKRKVSEKPRSRRGKKSLVSLDKKSHKVSKAKQMPTPKPKPKLVPLKDEIVPSSSRSRPPPSKRSIAKFDLEESPARISLARRISPPPSQFSLSQSVFLPATTPLSPAIPPPPLPGGPPPPPPPGLSPPRPPLGGKRGYIGYDISKQPRTLPSRRRIRPPPPERPPTPPIVTPTDIQKRVGVLPAMISTVDGIFRASISNIYNSLSPEDWVIISELDSPIGSEKPLHDKSRADSLRHSFSSSSVQSAIEGCEIPRSFNLVEGASRLPSEKSPLMWQTGYGISISSDFSTLTREDPTSTLISSLSSALSQSFAYSIPPISLCNVTTGDDDPSHSFSESTPSKIQSEEGDSVRDFSSVLSLFDSDNSIISSTLGCSGMNSKLEKRLRFFGGDSRLEIPNSTPDTFILSVTVDAVPGDVNWSFSVGFASIDQLSTPNPAISVGSSPFSWGISSDLSFVSHGFQSAHFQHSGIPSGVQLGDTLYIILTNRSVSVSLNDKPLGHLCSLPLGLSSVYPVISLDGLGLKLSVVSLSSLPSPNLSTKFVRSFPMVNPEHRATLINLISTFASIDAYSLVNPDWDCPIPDSTLETSSISSTLSSILSTRTDSQSSDAKFTLQFPSWMNIDHIKGTPISLSESSTSTLALLISVFLDILVNSALVGSTLPPALSNKYSSVSQASIDGSGFLLLISAELSRLLSNSPIDIPIAKMDLIKALVSQAGLFFGHILSNMATLNRTRDSKLLSFSAPFSFNQNSEIKLVEIITSSVENSSSLEVHLDLHLSASIPDSNISVSQSQNGPVQRSFHKYTLGSKWNLIPLLLTLHPRLALVISALQTQLSTIYNFNLVESEKVTIY